MNMKRLLQLKLSLVLLALLAVLGWSRAAGAQPAIASDRPGLGTGAVVLDAGTIGRKQCNAVMHLIEGQKPAGAEPIGDD